MLNIQKIFIAFMFLTGVFIESKVYASDFDLSGRWCWDKNSHFSTFTILIKKISNIYNVGYSSVTQGGNKIDDNDNAFSFKTSKNNMIKTIFTAGITGNKGIIQLKFIDEKKIEWSVLLYPSGEIYVPKKAILYKCK